MQNEQARRIDEAGANYDEIPISEKGVRSYFRQF